jgi:acyl-CoA synthetase (NDP forming)
VPPGNHLARLVRHLRARGRVHLLEDEGLPLAAELGLRTPAYVTLDGPDAAYGPDVFELPGERAVVKVLSHTLVHRAHLGGVRVVANEPSAIRQAIQEMEERLPAERRDAGRRRYLVATHMGSVTGVGTELLLGYRTTREFGPVVTLAPGGGGAETLAEALRDEQGPVILSPWLLEEAGLEDLLASRHFLAPALEPHEGDAPLLGMRRLVQLLREMAELARRGSRLGLAEFELNPILLTRDGPVAVDALGRLREEADPDGHPMRDPEALLSLLHPRSMAVVGASATRRNPGRIIVDNVLAAGFDPDELVVVKAGVEEVAGCRCVPSLEALEAPVDLLVVAVDAAQVPDVIDSVVRGARARAVILIPGGMDAGPEGDTPADRTARILAEARRRGDDPPVVVGPNCVGVRSVPGRFDTLFIPEDRLRFAAVDPDPVALVSQSGAFALTRAAGLPGLNPRYLVTLGNQLDVTLAECLHWLAADPEVRASAWYVEGFVPGDGRAWLEGARRMVNEGRPVLLYRAGRSEAGRAAASTHTASIAGDHRVVRELARQSGVWLAESIQDFHDGLRLLAAWQGLPPRGPGVGAVSNAGFECVALADTLGSGRLAELSDTTHAALRDLLGMSHLGGITTVTNPFDVTPMMGDEAFVDTVRLLLADPRVDVGVVGLVPLTPALNTPLNGGPPRDEATAWMEEGVVPGLLELWRERTKPWLVVLDAGPGHHRVRSALEEGGIPVLDRMDRVGPVLSGILRFSPRGF